MWIATSSERFVAGVVVRSAYRHEGGARRAIHELKYAGGVGFARIFAPRMAELVPDGAEMLVPVPRARTRLLVYGVDPAAELARALSPLVGLPVRGLLAPPWWAARRAGKPRSTRKGPAFRALTRASGGAVLIDDVVTSGATLAAAAQALSALPVGAVTATAA